jgi:hypothetical protein
MAWSTVGWPIDSAFVRRRGLPMKSILRLFVYGVAACTMFVASLAQAGIRDAGSKVRGEYGAPFSANDYRVSTTWNAPSQLAGRSSAEAVNNGRAYSYDSAPRRPDSANRAQAAQQTAPGSRRFSYEPNANVTPIRSLDRWPAGNGSSYRGGAARDATSKILGK